MSANLSAPTSAIQLPAGGSKLYISHFVNSDTVQIYDSRSPYAWQGKVTNGVQSPTGLAVDAAGDLFVANAAFGTVTKYPAGSTKPSATYSKGITDPLTVAVGPDGTLYVVSYTAPGQGSTILEYPAGSTDPSLTVKLKGDAEGMALDKKSDLYVAYNKANNTGTIVEFAPHSSKWQDLNMPLKFAGGLAFDEGGNIVASDQIAQTVDVFAMGSDKPSRQVKIAGSDLGSDPGQLVFDARRDRLYIANSVGHFVGAYSYPGLQLLHTYPKGIRAPIGVAVSPAASP